MFESLKRKAAEFALNKFKEKTMNPSLEGIGVIKEITLKDKQLHITMILEGLEDKPLTICASDIEIAPDGSSISINKYESNMPFAQNALARFVPNPLPIPEGSARTGVNAARKLLDL